MEWSLQAICSKTNTSSTKNESSPLLNIFATFVDHLKHFTFRRGIWQSNPVLGWGIWTQFWPKRAGIWTTQSSKVQMLGACPGGGGVDVSNWSAHYSTTLNTRLLIDKTKKNNISLKIFKTLFFKIYNPTFNKIHVPHKTLFQNTSLHKPQHNFNTSFPCTTIFSPETKTATINLIRLSEFYFTP